MHVELTVVLRQAECCPDGHLSVFTSVFEATKLVLMRNLMRNRTRIHSCSSFCVSARNFQVAHELLALQLLTVLLEEPTDDSVEIAVNFTKEIGQV